jgi:hypothetical protein
MAFRTITIPKEEYKRLKQKEELLDDALLQLHLSLEDLRHGRVGKFELKSS